MITTLLGSILNKPYASIMDHYTFLGGQDNDRVTSLSGVRVEFELSLS